MATDSPSERIASVVDDDDEVEFEATELRGAPASVHIAPARRPFLVRLTGGEVGRAHLIEKVTITIGRQTSCDLRLDDAGISRMHARITRAGEDYFIEDLGSSNGTRVNGKTVIGAAKISDGDKIHCGGDTILKFTFFDEVEERYHTYLHEAITKSDIAPVSATRPMAPWAPTTWRSKPIAQKIDYPDPEKLEQALARLRRLPPLVTSWEVDELKDLIAQCQTGRRFLLQGGDCAESHEDCESATITNKLKIMIQMSLVLIRGLRRPVVRIGRFAGQYAKPRSKPTEIRNGVELPSYFGDLVNRSAFTPEARAFDPNLMVDSYYHAALTLNFIRSMSACGLSDLRRPEVFDLSFTNVELPTTLRGNYTQTCREIRDGMHFLRSFGDRAADELMRVTFYASHEGLNLYYEEAQTRLPPQRERWYDLTTHMPWIGERTRQLDGAHVEFFRGLANPIGVKIGPSCTREEIVEICRMLNPQNEAGKLVLLTRMGANKVEQVLPPLIDTVRNANQRVLWVCDPMHGNAITTRDGIKTRDFECILKEVESSIMIHRGCGSYLGGVHFELTGDDVTECIGGGLTEADLTRNYASLCDPRLNYRQALQMAFLLSEQLDAVPAPSSIPPPSMRRGGV